LFLETPIERDEEECGRNGHAENIQYTKVVTYFNLTSSRSGLDWGTIRMKGTNGRGSDYRERKGKRDRWREGGEG
jgi:hypothetical protein